MSAAAPHQPIAQPHVPAQAHTDFQEVVLHSGRRWASYEALQNKATAIAVVSLVLAVIALWEYIGISIWILCSEPDRCLKTGLPGAVFMTFVLPAAISVSLICGCLIERHKQKQALISYQRV